MVLPARQAHLLSGIPVTAMRKCLGGQCEVFPQVEVWLNRVLDRMRATLRHEIPEAVVTYEEKPREQWIFDYPAQVWNRWGPTAVWFWALGHVLICWEWV